MSVETPNQQSPKQSPEAIQAEIVQARADFLRSLGQLREAFTPAALGQRGLHRAAGFFTDEFGGVRPGRVVAVSAVVVGFVAIKLIRRRG